MTSPTQSPSALSSLATATGTYPRGIGRFSDRRGFRLDFGGTLKLRRVGEKEAFLLAIICFLDMLTTLWWVTQGQASEANPILAWTFEHHPVWFVLLKCASCLPALYFITRLARKRPAFTVWLLRLAIAAYLGLYFLHVG